MEAVEIITPGSTGIDFEHLYIAQSHASECLTGLKQTREGGEGFCKKQLRNFLCKTSEKPTFEKVLLHVSPFLKTDPGRTQQQRRG